MQAFMHLLCCRQLYTFGLATICMTTHIEVLKSVQCSAEFSMDDSSFIKLHHLDKLHHQHLLTATKSHGNGAHSPVSELAAHLTELRLRGPSPATAPSPADAHSYNVSNHKSSACFLL